VAHLYDITPLVSADLAVWPGDTPPGREVLMDIQRGDNLTLSTLRSTVHVGAHADAPSHYGRDAPSIEQVGLEPYLGRCQVVPVVVDPGTRVSLAQLPISIEASRILLCTGTFPDPTRFERNFAAVAPELIEELSARGVELLGIDTPSVDLFESKDLPAHQACLRQGMAILEGLVLNGVPAGLYELIALPLRLSGFDASPVRAVLREIETGSQT
jgi:arylformamidase